MFWNHVKFIRTVSVRCNQSVGEAHFKYPLPPVVFMPALQQVSLPMIAPTMVLHDVFQNLCSKDNRSTFSPLCCLWTDEGLVWRPLKEWHPHLTDTPRSLSSQKYDVAPSTKGTKKATTLQQRVPQWCSPKVCQCTVSIRPESGKGWDHLTLISDTENIWRARAQDRILSEHLVSVINHGRSTIIKSFQTQTCWTNALVVCEAGWWESQDHNNPLNLIAVSVAALIESLCSFLVLLLNFEQGKCRIKSLQKLSI